MSLKSINLSTRNLIDNEDYKNPENQTELREDVDTPEREMHGSMEHPSTWDGVMAISVEEDLNNTISGTSNTSARDNSFNILPYCLKHLLLICCFVVSFSFGLASFLVLHVYSHKISKEGHNLFSILQHIGGYSFAGGIACILSFKLAFHSRFPLSLKTKRTRVMKSIVRKYLMREIFDLSFLKQFLRRTQSVELTDNCQLVISFINSSRFADWIHHKYRVIKEKPEGIILDSLGLQENELETYFKVFTTDLLISFEKIYLNNKDGQNHAFDPHRMKRYIDNITLEKFSNYETDIEFRAMVRSMVDIYMDHVVCCVIAIMAVVGLIVGSIKAFS